MSSQVKEESKVSMACDITEDSAGVSLLLLEALVRHGVLASEDVLDCIGSAVSCLSESLDHAVLVASAALLDACISSNSTYAEKDRSRGGDNEGANFESLGTAGSGIEATMPETIATAIDAASSPSVLLSIRTLLGFGEETENHGIGACRRSCLYREEEMVSWGHTASYTGRLDGSGFGAPGSGILDAAVSLLEHANVTPNLDEQHDSVRAQTLAERATTGSPCLWWLLYDHLEQGGRGELSPFGVTCVLRVMTRVLASSDIDTVALLQRGGSAEDLVAILCNRVLDRDHLAMVLGWRGSHGLVEGIGGGRGWVSVARIVAAAIAMLQATLTVAMSRESSVWVQEAFLAHGVVGVTVATMSFMSDVKKGVRTPGSEMGVEEEDEFEDALDPDDSGEVDDALCTCVNFLSRLVPLSPRSGAQFLDANGLEELASAGALLGTSPTPLLTGALGICSHVARASPDNYGRLRAAGVDASLGPLLAHPEPTVRARACSLVGNLCRHSAFFYKSLSDDTVQTWPIGTVSECRGGDFVPARGCPRRTSFGRGGLDRDARGGRDVRQPATDRRGGRSRSAVELLIQRCADPDPPTRKFACFAVGNAAFHSDALYRHLAPSVPPLVMALGDSEEKTRANAAGALGNLVRNSGDLSMHLAEHGAVAALVGLATRDVAVSPRRVALFSLGTCCAYAPCREALALAGRRGVRSGLRDGSLDGEAGEARCGERSRIGEAAIPPSITRCPSETAGITLVVSTIERRFWALDRESAGMGDDSCLRYVARLRNKLSGPPHA